MKEDNNINKNKKHEFLRIIFVIIITAIVTYFCTITFTVKSYLKNHDLTYFTTKINLIKQKLDKEYIGDINEENMIESAVSGYVKGVGDKYTQYYTKEEMNELKESTAGNYVGIGIYMADNTADNSILIIGVIEDSAAEKAGLKAGDIITKVDGVSYSGEQLDSVANIVRGQEGTNVNITIKRDSQEKEFNITRATVKIKTVSYKMLDNNIGYIKISEFNEGTANEFKNAYNNIKGDNPQSVIIDLRNNGGGLVNEALEISETMTEKGKNLLITKNSKDKEEIQKSKQDPVITIPVTVLINKNSASASEILAGILKDDCNSKIVGEKSYGKGVIQTVYQFTDGTGIKITTEEYFTPNHNQINKLGITPDIESKLDPEWENVSNVPYENDLQLKEAVKSILNK